eukprot:373680-Hanusia_phi.AAC.7
MSVSALATRPLRMKRHSARLEGMCVSCITLAMSGSTGGRSQEEQLLPGRTSAPHSNHTLLQPAQAYSSALLGSAWQSSNPSLFPKESQALREIEVSFNCPLESEHMHLSCSSSFVHFLHDFKYGPTGRFSHIKDPESLPKVIEGQSASLIAAKILAPQGFVHLVHCKVPFYDIKASAAASQFVYSPSPRLSTLSTTRGRTQRPSAPVPPGSGLEDSLLLMLTAQVAPASLPSRASPARLPLALQKYSTFRN